MTNESGTGDKGGDEGGARRGSAEPIGPSEIPEESVSSESELALENQVAKQESDDEGRDG